ncbi:MAG TPA: O-antigen ligase family protein [bacterium]|nr:O-antigen ligase family protein [bacterium]HOL34241.1 O-antigen ligase family protein [bacterium]HPP07704.1 O-antigen ligase family protein [bacterium]
MSKKKKEQKIISQIEKKDEETLGFKALVIMVSILFFGIAPLLNFKPAYDYTIIKDVLGALSVAIFAAALFLKRDIISFDFTGFFTGTLFFTFILVGCFYAPVKYGAAQVLENYLLYYLLFIMGLLWKWDKRDAFIWASAMIIASITAFVQYPKTHYPISTFGNPNFFAGHLLMPLFLSIYFFKKEYHTIAIPYFIITLAALILTKSRASLFAVLAGCSFASFLLLQRHRIPWLKYAGFLFVIFVTVILWNKILVQFRQDIRYYIWRGTWNLIKQHMITGWGTGNFIFYYPYFRFREYFLRPQATPITNHPHCQYLEIWSENGVIGLALFLLVIGMAIYHGMKAKDEESKNIFLFASTGIIAVLIDNILSTNMTNTSTAMYFWFLLGLCFGSKNLNTVVVSSSYKKIAAGVIMMSSIILAGWKTFYRMIPEVYLKRAITAREANDFLSAIENYKKVCKINPNNVVALYKMAYAYGQIGDIKNAEEVYLKINNNLFPHFAKTDANLGTLYMQKQNFEKAKFYYEKALWFNPYDVEVLLQMASIKIFHDKDIEGAREYLKKVMSINPEHEYVQYLLKNIPELKNLDTSETKNR